MAIVKALVLLQLSVLLPSFFTVFAVIEVDSLRLAPSYPLAQPLKHGGHHGSGGGHHKKTPRPSSAPVLSALSSHPAPITQDVIIQGLVYCKPCKYVGIDTLEGAIPLQGAVVVAVCNDTNIPTNAISNQVGIYSIIMKNRDGFLAVVDCKAYLVSSPSATCNKPTNLHFGVKGATLTLTKTKPSLPLIPTKPKPVAPSDQLYRVGPFAFEPAKKC